MIRRNRTNLAMTLPTRTICTKTRRYAVSIWLFTVACVAAFATQAAPNVGQSAPDFSLIATDGSKVNLSDYRGQYVILEWTNHDCPFVRKHYDSGNMQALQKQETGQGAVWLTIISSAKGKQGYVSAGQADQLTASRNALPTSVLLDTSGEVGRSYGAKTTPHMYIIEPDGNLAYMGAIDSIRSADPDDIGRATNYVTQAMGELRGGSAVSEPVTRPYGCSVKY